MSNTKKQGSKPATEDQKEVIKAGSGKVTSAIVVESFRDKDNYDTIHAVGQTIKASPERIQHLKELGLVEVTEEAVTTDPPKTDPPKEGGEGGGDEGGGDNDPK